MTEAKRIVHEHGTLVHIHACSPGDLHLHITDARSVGAARFNPTTADRQEWDRLLTEQEAAR